MNVNLTPELEALVQRKVESGLYNNQSEVVREALRLLAEQERLREAHLGRLRGVQAKSLMDADPGLQHGKLGNTTGNRRSSRSGTRSEPRRT
jgi:antitoxin ParD1/3/4